jgi:hypothetical protein
VYELLEKRWFGVFERCVSSIFSIELVLVAQFNIVLEKAITIAIDWILVRKLKSRTHFQAFKARFLQILNFYHFLLILIWFLILMKMLHAVCFAISAIFVIIRVDDDLHVAAITKTGCTICVNSP